MSIIVIIAAVIAAIGIGFMCGSIVNIRRTSVVERSNIGQNYQLEQQDDVAAGNAQDDGSGR